MKGMLQMRKIRIKLKEMLKSVKVKLFLTLCVTVLCIIFFLIILNSFGCDKIVCDWI